MNESPFTQLQGLVEHVVRPVRAAGNRKTRMRDELLAHLIVTFDEEAAKVSPGDEQAAIVATQQRFGDTKELRRQLQASVPLPERVLFFCFPPMENVMSRWMLGIIVVIAALFLIAAVVPKYGAFIVVGSIAIVAALALIDLRNQDGFVSRILSPRLLGLLGCIGILFGPSIILPAMAKLKQGIILSNAGQEVRNVIVTALVIGILILLEGICFLACGLLMRRKKTA